MSVMKGKKADRQTIAPRPSQVKPPRIQFQLNSRALQRLNCFVRKRSGRKDNKRISRIKLTASGKEELEEEKTQQVETAQTVLSPEAQERIDRVSADRRKKEQSTSPDLANVLMNEVIYKIVRGGPGAEEKEDEKQREPTSPTTDNLTLKELQMIWQPNLHKLSQTPPLTLSRIEEAQKSFVSTEGDTMASRRNSYFNPQYVMMPAMQHLSLNSTFSYTDDKMYPPNYYGYKWSVGDKEPNNRRIFQINYEMIERDGRTTVMIKNIPNKYSLKLLSDEIDEAHANMYDFLYLPFDFDNNCNVGYAFINFLNTACLKTFYENFNNKKWLKFRSVKICALTYARLQGKNSLIEHFHNSKVLNQKEKRFRPIIRDIPQLSEMLEKQRKNQQEGGSGDE